MRQRSRLRNGSMSAARTSPRSSIIGAGSPIAAASLGRPQTFAPLQDVEGAPIGQCRSSGCVTLTGGTLLDRFELETWPRSTLRLA